MSGAALRTRTQSTAALREIQAPVQERLEDVVLEMRRVVTADQPLIEQVSGHLLQIRGKMFRPTLALLASETADTPDARVVTLAAVLELMHLASLVHDDSVDHSALRRGLPTVNSLFSHQVSVIMGDFLYSRALEALVSLGDLDLMRVLTQVSCECETWLVPAAGHAHLEKTPGYFDRIADGFRRALARDRMRRQLR